MLLTDADSSQKVGKHSYVQGVNISTMFPIVPCPTDMYSTEANITVRVDVLAIQVRPVQVTNWGMAEVWA